MKYSIHSVDYYFCMHSSHEEENGVQTIVRCTTVCVLCVICLAAAGRPGHSNPAQRAAAQRGAEPSSCARTAHRPHDRHRRRRRESYSGLSQQLCSQLCAPSIRAAPSPNSSCPYPSLAAEAEAEASASCAARGVCRKQEGGSSIGRAPCPASPFCRARVCVCASPSPTLQLNAMRCDAE